MPSLHDTQALVMGALRSGTTLLGVDSLLRPARQISGERRLQVYRNNFRAGLGAALEAVYPVLARLVGAAYFRALARDYVDAHPSRSGNLHEFGADLPAFLRTRAALSALPYLADVAALEWAAHEVYHEQDNAELDPVALAALAADDPARVRLHLQPATRFVGSAYPVLAIWQANQPGAGEDAGASLDDGGVHLLVARAGFEVEFRILGAAEARWLRALAEGRALGAALEAARGVDPAFDLGAALGRHLALGTFRACSPAPEEAR